ncbi:nuclear hormone receptor HR96 [Phlebotomus argentipes]|uniref:nuclear hormone receptor HR96 n=1 Tax=Phlebotomus argentipes TaxID=94469 RepID=UPI002892D95E|nr:nuclear hormone receptor HR96 [Phlebotomus argentipes]
MKGSASPQGDSGAGKLCSVCGDKALGYNFNAITCESCKAFFRRNALATKPLTCPFSDQCEITVVTRRFCQKCRLEKCFAIGMKKEYIMSEEDKIQKRKKIEQNRARKKLAMGEPPVKVKREPMDSDVWMQRPEGFGGCEGNSSSSEASYQRQEGQFSSPETTGSLNSPTTPTLASKNLPTIESSPSEIVNSIVESSDVSRVINRLMKTQEDAIDVMAKILNSPKDAIVLISHFVGQPGDALKVISKIMNSPFDALTVFTKFMSSPTDALEIIAKVVSSPNDVLQFLQQLMRQPEDGLQIMQKFINAPAEALKLINNMMHQSKVDSTSGDKSPELESQLKTILHSIQPSESPKSSIGQSPGVMASSTCDGAPSEEAELEPKEDEARMILEDVEKMPILPNSIESVLCEAIKLEYEGCSSMGQSGTNSRELNDAERAKLNELIVANKALYAPVDEDLSSLISDDYRMRTNHNQQDPQLLKLVNLTAVAIRRLIKMSKKISAFKNMCQEDQVALLKGGCTEMMILRSVMQYDSDRASWKIPHNLEEMSRLKADVLKLAKGNVYEEHERFILTFDPKWRTDENIILIMCAITLFSPDRPRIVHSDVIKLEQNSYYYLLRRYLESVYPGCEARSTFLKLIQKVNELRKLNEVIISVYLDVNPSQVEPLLREIFDMKNH